MDVKFCVATNAYIDMVPNTKPQKFDGQAAFFYDELVNVMDRYGK